MTIRSRLTLSIVLLVAVVVLVLSIAIYVQFKRADQLRLDALLTTVAARMAADIEDEWEEELDPEWDTIFEIEHDELPILHISLHEAAGTPLVQSDSSDPLSPWEGQGGIEKSRFSDITRGDGPYRRADIPIFTDDTVGFVLTLAAPSSESRKRLAGLATILAIASGLALLFAGVAVSIITRRAFAPIEKMVQAAEQIQEGSLDKRVPVAPTGDEVARLGGALNAMMTRIEAAFATQQQFVADASHELRTPLTVLIGELEHLQREIRSEELQTSVQTSLSELDRLTRIVDSLLTIARADAGRLSLQRVVVRLDELVIETVAFLTPEAKRRGIELYLQIDEGVEIIGDSARLKSLLIAVIENGLKYSPRGGQVVVHLHVPDTRYVGVTISDTGSGIPAEDIPHIFERFHRSAQARSGESGSGLGLAIAQSMAELHGGSLELASTGPSGSMFRLSLPVKS